MAKPRSCVLTRHLARVWNHRNLIEPHIQRCEACQNAAAVLHVFQTTPLEDEGVQPTPECPDDSILRAYEKPYGDPEAEHELATHVLTCRYCLSRLPRRTLGQEEVRRLVADADRALETAEQPADSTIETELDGLLVEAAAAGIELGSYSLEDVKKVRDKQTQEGLIRILRYLLEKRRESSE